MINIFTLEEIIYMMKTIKEQRDDEDYKFKKDIQKILDNLEFKKYVEVIEVLEEANLHFEKSNELNSLNILHLEIKDYVNKNLKKYLKNSPL